MGRRQRALTSWQDYSHFLCRSRSCCCWGKKVHNWGGCSRDSAGSFKAWPEGPSPAGMVGCCQTCRTKLHCSARGDLDWERSMKLVRIPGAGDTQVRTFYSFLNLVTTEEIQPIGLKGVNPVTIRATWLYECLLPTCLRYFLSSVVSKGLPPSAVLSNSFWP